MDTNLKGTGIRLPKNHIEQLDAIAAKKRVSRNVVILWALDEYLAHFSLPACPSCETNDDREIHPADAAA